MKRPIYLTVAIYSLLVLSCVQFSEHSTKPEFPIKEGSWRVVMKLPDAELPFNLVVNKKDSEYIFTVINDVERIPVKDVVIQNDSIFISMPVFQSELIGKIESDSSFSGAWYNYTKGADYHIPFHAVHGTNLRFAPLTQEANSDITGRWEVTFSQESEDFCKAIGVFNQQGNKLSGTFLTETGDYRFLEGEMVADSIFLSCFDGSHGFLFQAHVSENGLSGQFWSGKHWKESWVAVRNDAFALTDPDSLTFLREGYDALSFTFPDLDSTLVSLNDEKFENKTIIVQIMGSWCPNCADETAFLSDLYRTYNSQGLEIIALAYENGDSFYNSVEAVRKLKDHFSANYDFLIAGKANKKEAGKTLPMLNHIMSYPTCIFIDKDKRIRKIRTGFFGPGTGEIYEQNIQEMTAFTEQLLQEAS